jgi:TolB-like protein
MNALRHSTIVLRAGAVLALLTLHGTAHAQSRTTVAILPIAVTSNENSFQYSARALEGHVVQSLSKLGRVTVLDRTQNQQVASEREAQKSVDFIDSRTLAAQGQSLGAQLVLTANIDKTTVTQERLDDGSTYYKSNVSATVRLIDVSTQEVKSSAVLTADAESGGKKGLGGMLNSLMTTHRTPNDAVTAAAKNLIPGLDGFLKEAFPARFTIAQVEEIAGDSAQGHFLLDGGKNLGARPKTILTVLEVTEVKVGARLLKREREIGTMEIVKLDGEELSIGHMRGGARNVAQLLAAGKSVHAVLR